ncbi:MAG: phosphoglucosamine mutase [Deltaproteobacteria bacterium]
MSENGRTLFGTDGVRGIANCEPMTPEMSLRLGKALTHVLKDSRRPKVVIGKDTRLSGYMFEQALSAGIASVGGDVLLVGPLPTPAIAFLTGSMRADAGVVISASHNPYEDNGIKIFDRFGFKLPDEKELEIERAMLSGEAEKLFAPAGEIGKAFRIEDARGRYVVFVKNTFPRDITLEGIKIVLDCANGAAYRVAPLVFEELGASVTVIGASPNGKNINAKCGALYPDLLKQKVVEAGADIGIALDGDADRVIFSDEKGAEVDGDKIMAICADELIKSGSLSNNTVVATIMSNMALEAFVRESRANFVRTPVGDRYVVDEMKRRGSNFGGEKSGHIIFLSHNTTGDGTLAALQILAVMKQRGRPLSELSKIIEPFPQTLVSVRVKSKKPFNDIPDIGTLFDSCSKKLGGRGRINLRYSGTEPLARVMVEGECEILIAEIANDISSLIEKHLG